MDRVAADERRDCPDCTASLPEDANVCPNCGAAITAGASGPTPVEAESPQHAAPSAARDTPSRLLLGVGLCAALLLFAIVAVRTFSRNSTATDTICKTADGQRVADLLQASAQQWDDANRQAGSSTSRSALAPQVSQLQRIKRDVQVQPYPPCGQQAQTLLIEMMDHTISGYNTYLQQESDLLVTMSFTLAREKQDAFTVALLALDGLPPPSPTSTTSP
jgi:hypothetical protein